MAVERATILGILVFASTVNVFMLFVYLHTLGMDTGTAHKHEIHRKLLLSSETASTKMAAKMEHFPSSTTKFPNLLDILFGHPSNETRKKEALKGPRLNRLLNVTATKYIINKEEVCKDDGVSIMAAVVSAANHFEAREAIRATWGHQKQLVPLIHLIFFIGRTTEDNQVAILDEDKKNKDIVQADFIDSYRNLTFKSVLLLRWAIKFCPNINFLFKVDDDVFVNVPNLINLTEQHSNLNRTIIGKLAVNWRPIRDKSSPYYVPQSTWNSIIYPKFLTGPSYLITGDALSHLYHHAINLPFFFLEDVFITGMAAEMAKIKRLDYWGFHNSKTVINPCLLHKVVSSHWLSPIRLRAAWNISQNYDSNFNGCWYSKCFSHFLGVCLSTVKAPIDFYPRKPQPTNPSR